MTRVTVLGRLTASEKDKRILSGLLLPYGQEGSTNLGKVTCAPGVIDVPVTMGRLAASLRHPARDTGSGECASFLRVWEEADGMHASWRVADTPAGNTLLAEYEAGKRTGVSVELDPVAIDEDGNIVAGRLDACAFPERPAFDAARLCASAPPVELDEDRDVERLLADFDSETTSTSTEEYDDPDTGEHVVVTYVRTTRETATETRDGDAVEDTEDEGDDVGDVAEDERLVASRRSAGRPRPASAGRSAGAPAGTQRGKVSERDKLRDTTTLDQVCRMMAAAHGGDRAMYAALSDVTETNTRITRPPAWLGELWTAQPYSRKIIPLLNKATLTNLRVKGFRWTKKPYMAAYAGDKGNVPSDTVALEEYEDKAKRAAGAHDIDRAHVDFGDTEFFKMYFAAMAESYARLTDEGALAAIVAEAPVATLGPVPADIDPGTSAVVDIALSLLDRGLMTSAIVAKDVFRSMLLTPSDKRLAFLSQSLGLDGGDVANFRVVPDTKLAPGQVVGLIKGGVTYRELGETPIRADALDLARGGVDNACYGYWHVETNEDALAQATVDLTP